MFEASMIVVALIGQVSANDPVVSGIKTAYEANRSALAYGKSHFTYRVGNTVADGFYAFDGTNIRYDLLVSGEALLANRVKTGPNAWSSGPVKSYRVLSDGQSTLVDHHFPDDSGEIVYQPQIEAGADHVTRTVLFPLDLGIPNLGDWHVSKDIDLARKGSGAWKLESVDERATLDKVNVVLLTFTDKGFRRQYWIDLAKNAIPLRVVDTAESGGRIQVDNGDIRWVGNKGWLPFRYTISLGGAPPKEFVIQNADFDSRPDRSVFRLEFPEPIKIVDVGRKVVYAPQKIWDLSELPGRNSPNAKPIDLPDTFAAAPQHPGELTSRPPWLIPLTIFGVAVLGLAGILLWRRRHA